VLHKAALHCPADATRVMLLHCCRIMMAAALLHGIVLHCCCSALCCTAAALHCVCCQVLLLHCPGSTNVNRAAGIAGMARQNRHMLHLRLQPL
jgi:hypothetical protein